MFGIFFYLAKGISSILGKQVEDVKNEQNKVRFANPNGLTYIDERGGTRLISNNHHASYKIANTRFDKYMGVQDGDYILVDLDDKRKLIHNFNLEERLKKIGEMAEKYKDYSTEPYDDNLHTGRGEVIWGKRYYDKETGEEFVIRHYSIYGEGSAEFYLSTKTGLFVRQTDYSKKWKRRLTAERANDFIVNEMGWNTPEKRLRGFSYDDRGRMADYYM